MGNYLGFYLLLGGPGMVQKRLQGFAVKVKEGYDKGD